MKEFYKKLGITTVASSIIALTSLSVAVNYTGQKEETLLASTTVVKNAQVIDDLDFGVGYGVNWESGIFAPFADITAWVSDSTYSNSGALNLGQVTKDTGVLYYNLGFINAVDNTVENGVLNWGFGAYQVLSEKYGASNEQYQGIKKTIKDVRDAGGDVVISFGGLNERNFFQYTTDIDVLVNTYIEIIDGFNLTRIDLDIEGSAQGYETNKLNAEALKIVQEKTGVEIVLTLPVLPTGLTTNLGLPTLQVYLDEGVDIVAVNIMAMCYGSYYQDYAIGSIDAIDSTMLQIKDAYKNVGIILTNEDAYNKVGITTSIGYEGYSHPIFTTDDSQLVVDYASAKGINFVSFWSLNRDSMTQSNEGIYNKYEHTNIYSGFDSNYVPSITPEEEPQVEAETKPGVEEPHVDTTTPGEPEVDNTPEVLPEVEEEVLPEYVGGYLVWSREQEAAGAYVPGYIVTHKGIIYKQVTTSTVWWCEPGTDSSIWQAIAINLGYVEPVPTEYNRVDEAAGLYTPSTKVTYKGTIYEQVSLSVSWWCEPGTNSNIWAAIGTDESYVAPVPTEYNRVDEAAGLYTPGTIVLYNGRKYLQISSSTSWWCEPGTDISVWEPIS